MNPAHLFRGCLKALGWTLVWLLALDLTMTFVVGRLALRHPKAGSVRYFQYGRSIEGKLDKTTRLPRNAQDALILAAGWLDPAGWAGLPERPQVGSDKLMAVYGQSFALNVSRAVATLDGHLTIRPIAGPGAPPDHSYAAYLADAANAHADVVIFGILASSVSHMGSMSGTDWTFEHPAPFTFPRFTLHEGQLEAEAPVFQTERQFRAAFADQAITWAAFKEQLRRNDRGFDPLTFDRTWLDSSEIALLLRRGWAAHSQDYNAGVYDPTRGFVDSSEQMQVLRAMLSDLGKRTRTRGQRLIVLLEQDQGYGDSLYRALGPTLTRAQVEFLSTHTIFSANDPRNFQSDGHYTESANLLFARQLMSLIRNVPTTSHSPPV